MKTRKFGRVGWPVSEIGFGAWGIGQKWWGATEDNESKQAIQAALDRGINFFDTAFVYGDGHSEQILGEALHNQKVFIATKIPPKNHGWPGKAETPAPDVFPAEWIVSCTELSLQRLKRDALDLQQFHVWHDAWLRDDGWKSAIQKLKQQGKIKAFGVSINDHDPNSTLELVKSGLIDSVQVIFNIFDQSPLERLFPLCLERKVAVIVRVALDEGGLTGTLTPETTFEAGDFRKQYFRGERLQQTVSRVEKLKNFLDAETPKISDLALKFALAQEAVSVVIAGMRRLRHVEANAAVSESPRLQSKVVADLKDHAWQRNFYGWWDEKE